MKRFYIGDIPVGAGAPVLVIPEIGINHGGSLSAAKEMVDAAKRAGAFIVKHQTHVVEDEMCSAAKKISPGNSGESIYGIMEKCALTAEEEFELMQYTQKRGMVFLSTPFSRAAADRLNGFGVKAFKVGSGEMNNYPLLRHIASFGKPMIVSTGMNGMESIKKAVAILEDSGVGFALMHTTNLYPTPPRLVRLGAMRQLAEAFPCAPVGLSDHSVSNSACIAAIAMGAHLVERHFTDRMDRIGPDIICSMDEQRLKELVCAARDVPEMLGGTKNAAPEEKVTIDFAFSSVVTLKSINKGETFTEKNVWVKRPGTGEIHAEYYHAVLGKTASCDIKADVLLEKAMVEGFEEL